MLTDSQHCWLRWLEFSRGIRGNRNITKLEREFCECFMLFPAFYVCSLLSLAAAATNATDMYACCDKTFSRQTFVATKIILSRQTRLLLRQKNACRDKHVFAFVATKIFCHDKHNFVATKVFSRQPYFCRDNGRALSRQTRCCDKHVSVATKPLSRQR